jgi:hypothetical protein
VSLSCRKSVEKKEREYIEEKGRDVVKAAKF